MKKFIRFLIGCTMATLLIWAFSSIYNNLYYEMHEELEKEIMQEK